MPETQRHSGVALTAHTCNAQRLTLQMEELLPSCVSSLSIDFGISDTNRRNSLQLKESVFKES